MAMTLRLSDDAAAALERITVNEQITATQAISDALIEYDAKRTAVRDALLQQIVTERQDLLDRLG